MGMGAHLAPPPLLGGDTDGPWRILPRSSGAVPAAQGFRTGHDCPTPGSPGALLIAGPAGGCAGARARRTVSCSGHQIPATRAGRAHLARTFSRGRRARALGAGRGWEGMGGWGGMGWDEGRPRGASGTFFSPPFILARVAWRERRGLCGVRGAVPGPNRGGGGWGRFRGGVPSGIQCPSCQRPAIPTRARPWRAATLPVSRSCREGVGQGACWRRRGLPATPHASDDSWGPWLELEKG